MAINHIVVHLKETKVCIQFIQNQGRKRKDIDRVHSLNSHFIFAVKLNPLRGFWLISAAAFIVAPFLTNDGVCLLFVEIILNAFDDDDDDQKQESSGGKLVELVEVGHRRLANSHDQATGPIIRIDDATNLTNDLEKNPRPSLDTVRNSSSWSLQRDLLCAPAAGEDPMKLERTDAVYFLLSLACASNIGSCLTYTGNPQNMIVAMDAIDVMPPFKFLLIMLLPSLLAWVGST